MKDATKYLRSRFSFDVSVIHATTALKRVEELQDYIICSTRSLFSLRWLMSFARGNHCIVSMIEQMEKVLALTNHSFIIYYKENDNQVSYLATCNWRSQQ